jgi:hypothetical protein
MPAARSAAVQSNSAPWPSGSGRDRRPTITAAIPIGRLIMNSQGQLPKLRMIAASVGPAAADADRTIAL